jgi:hypothetical protein
LVRQPRGIRPIARALAAYHEIADGDLYPRWISTGYLGKGVPLFNFYPPAFSLLVAYAHALGVPLLLAAKLTIFLLFFVGGLGTYLWARPHLGSFPALVAGILYLYAPYHFVDIYVRGATAEFTSLAVLPYLFFAIDMLIDRLSARGLAFLGVASAATVLSHFLGALVIAPFAAVYALARAVQTGGRWIALGRIVAGGALGAALSAFYWLPALVERDALSSERRERAISSYYTYFLHFVHPKQWLDPVGDLAVPSLAAATNELPGGALILVSAAAARSWCGAGSRPRLRPAHSRAGIAALWLTARRRGSGILASAIPADPVPWRFLGPATVFRSGGRWLRARAHGTARSLGGPDGHIGDAALALSAQQRTVRGGCPSPTTVRRSSRPSPPTPGQRSSEMKTSSCRSTPISKWRTRCRAVPILRESTSR